MPTETMLQPNCWIGRPNKQNSLVGSCCIQINVHDKSARELMTEAVLQGFELKITSTKEVQQAPPGFGFFSLLFNGKLLEDDYIRPACFKNIAQEVLKNGV